jgi:aminopeptidase N
MSNLTSARLPSIFALTLSLSLGACSVLTPAARPITPPPSSLQASTPTATVSESGSPATQANEALSPPATTAPPETPLPPTETPGPAAGTDSIGDPYAPGLGNTGYDVQRYHLQLKLDPAVVFVEGRTTLTATAQTHNLSSFSLDFAGFQISDLTLNGEVPEFFREGEKLHIEADPGLSINETFVLTIAYSGQPLSQPSIYVPFVNHLGLQFLGSNLYALSQPDGAHFWFPANDHPLDKALFSFEISVPEGLTAVANGVLRGEWTEAGQSTYMWTHDFPMATYLATVAVGSYERLEVNGASGIPIRHYVFSDIRPQFEQATQITDEGLTWMSEQFGPYPFETFGFVTSRLIRASLETQTTVVLSELMLNEETVIHEIIHAWFGNWVSMASWADMWHNEGFAVYLSLAWQTRHEPANLNHYMNNQAVEILAGTSGLPLASLPPSQLFATDSYWGGAVLIHELRQLMGDQAFFDGLRSYLERYGGGTATRNEFIQEMEQASGLELDTFFAEWLE